MKSKLMMLPLALALLSSPAWAQQYNQSLSQNSPESADSTQSAAVTDSSGEKILHGQDESQKRADNFIGASVLSGGGEDAEEVGKITDLVFDEEDRIVAAVIGVGGFLGVGEKSVAVAWEELESNRENDTVWFTTSLTREALEEAPEFKTAEDQLAEREAAERMQQQMQQQPGMTQNPAQPGTVPAE